MKCSPNTEEGRPRAMRATTFQTSARPASSTPILTPTTAHHKSASGLLSAGARAPSSAVDAVDLLRFDFLVETLDVAASFAVSAREAARRGNPELLRLHAGQARQAVDAALEVVAELGSLEKAPA